MSHSLAAEIEQCSTAEIQVGFVAANWQRVQVALVESRQWVENMLACSGSSRANSGAASKHVVQVVVLLVACST